MPPLKRVTVRRYASAGAQHLPVITNTWWSMDVDSELRNFVCSTIALACNRDPLTVVPETTMWELNIDSLTFVAVLTQVQAVYEFELGPDTFLILFQADSVAELVESLGQIICRAGSVEAMPGIRS